MENIQVKQLPKTHLVHFKIVGRFEDIGIACELYHNNHDEHLEKKHIVDICMPIN